MRRVIWREDHQQVRLLTSPETVDKMELTPDEPDSPNHWYDVILDRSGGLQVFHWTDFGGIPPTPRELCAMHKLMKEKTYD